MYAVCDKCGTTTSKTKQIVSKKNGQTYTVFVCIAGCKSGKYEYSFFPPKEAPGKSQPERQPQAQGGEAVNLLRSIDTTLKNVLAILQTQARTVPVQPEELGPDQDIPF